MHCMSVFLEWIYEICFIVYEPSLLCYCMHWHCVTSMHWIVYVFCIFELFINAVSILWLVVFCRTKHLDTIDIYDFGVILLEIVSGRPIISTNELDIMKDEVWTVFVFNVCFFFSFIVCNCFCSIFQNWIRKFGYECEFVKHIFLDLLSLHASVFTLSFIFVVTRKHCSWWNC